MFDDYVKKDIRYQKRIRNIFILAFLVGLIFMVSTYARLVIVAARPYAIFLGLFGAAETTEF